jgi:hypothetical protein
MRGRKQTDRRSGDGLRTAVFAGAVAALLVSGVAMVAAATTVDLGPKVGDILVFRAGARMPTDWDFTARSATQPTATCTLRPEVMAVAGGSLVVEERNDKPRTYRVHWAGNHTSPGATDCGATAELILQHADLQLLSNAVGGPGVEHRLFNLF